MLSPCSCPRSPVSGAGGGGRACGEGGRKAPGRCGARGARRPGSGRRDSPGLQDYSVRHALRRTALRGEWSLGVCGASSWSRCGPGRGQSSLVSRSGALSPVLRTDVVAQSLHVRSGKKNLRIFSPLVSNSEGEEMA